jgi:hypothetical protein
LAAELLGGWSRAKPERTQPSASVPSSRALNVQPITEASLNELDEVPEATRAARAMSLLDASLVLGEILAWFCGGIRIFAMSSERADRP